MTRRERIEAALDRRWNAAAASGDTDTLVVLREAYEANALGLDDCPVLVDRLTSNQVAAVEGCFPEGSDVLASGASWVVMRSADGVRDLIAECPTMADEAEERAMGNNLDMTDAQEAFAVRAARGSIDNLSRKLSRSLGTRRA